MSRVIPVAVFSSLLLLSNRIAQADQCQQVSTEQANKAATLLPASAKFLVYCPPCGDKALSSWQTVGEVAVVGSGTAPREVRINGNAVDLAYVFYAATDGKAHNLALAAGCNAIGVPAALDLQQPQAPAKRYKLALTVEIMTSKANGKRWDPAGDAPDPVVKATMFQSNKKVRDLTCRQKETYTSTCLTGTVIEANDATIINAGLEDEDGISNDDIGWVHMPMSDAIGNLGKAVTLKTGGQIKSATLTLTAVE